MNLRGPDIAVDVCVMKSQQTMRSDNVPLAACRTRPDVTVKQTGLGMNGGGGGITGIMDDLRGQVELLLPQVAVLETRLVVTEAALALAPLNPGIINTEMLQSCWSDGASRYPTPDRWSRTAVPFLPSLGPKDNGQSLSVPG